MAPLNSTPIQNISDISGLAQGWMLQPEGRRALSILISCITTIFLCSWSVLCLNIPVPGGSRWDFLEYKLRWQIFTIFFSRNCYEHGCRTVGISQSKFPRVPKTRVSTVDYASRVFGRYGWIRPPKSIFPSVSVDSEQLAYLVKKEYLQYSAFDEETIGDRNEADGFACCITSVQITSFSIQCVGR